MKIRRIDCFQRKLTARRFLAQFPDSTPNHGLLENMGCPKCGQRDYFRIEFRGLARVDDDSSDDSGDHEWEAKSYCRCGTCDHSGKVRDFTFKGLEELIDSCKCADFGWHGEGHTHGCPLRDL
jgi:hypothetical protein